MDREELKEVLDELWVCQNLQTLCVRTTEVTTSLLCNIFQRVTQENQAGRELLAKLVQRYVLYIVFFAFASQEVFFKG